MKMKISDISKIKNRPVITIAPGETVQVAIQKLVENNIGALPVCDAKGALLGIITERDLLKECSKHVRAIGDIKVEGVMTRDVATGNPKDDLDSVMSVMIQKGIRHLPIMVGRYLDNIISMRDIVDALLEDSNAAVRQLSRQLTDYIIEG